MIMTNRISPYTRLKKIALEWAVEALYPSTRTMWCYPKNRLQTESWCLTTLYERTAAAEQLGYDVKLKATDNGLEVRYVKKVPELPWELQ